MYTLPHGSRRSWGSPSRPDVSPQSVASAFEIVPTVSPPHWESLSPSPSLYSTNLYRSRHQNVDEPPQTILGPPSAQPVVSYCLKDPCS